MEIRNKFLLSATTLAVCALMNQAAAQQVADATNNSTPQRVEITGSALKRADAETALPVSVIKAEEFSKLGYTSIADVMQSLSVGSTQNALSAGGGTVFNMRGLGLARTLVLLDGQRMANEPTADSYANVETIPMSAIDRIEILRDGASSLYGSDAVAGVVNFITKKSYDGVTLTVGGVTPTQSGGANEERFSIIGGKGNLNRDGWTLYGTIDFHNQTALPYSARPEFVNNNALNALGIGPGVKTAGAGGYAYPANITAGANKGNPYSTTCLAPYSSPAPSSTCANNNTQLYGVLFPESKQISSLVSGQFKLASDNILTVQMSYGYESRVIPKGSPSTSVGFTPPPGQGSAPVMTITPSSPFYPGGSAGVPNVLSSKGKGETGTLTLQWQDDAQGGAVYKDTQANARFLVNDVGHFGNWDYKSNLVIANNTRIDTTVNGYLNGPLLDAGVLNGIINPFGAQTAAGTAYINSISEDGKQIRHTTSGYDSIDFSATHDLFEMGGGTSMANLGGAFHRDAFHDVSPANNINIPYNGRMPYDVHASRNVGSLFGEIDFPITKQLDLDIGVRADDYTDVGSSVNPKVSLRYQPASTFTMRASYNTGFRAPSLNDMHGYRLPGATTTTSAKWDDPLLCPGTIGVAGTGTISAAALAAGLTSAQVCNIKQPVQTGSNPNLSPEKSKNFTAGFVLEPFKNAAITVDYWNVKLTNTLGSLSETAIFDNPALYAANFVRNSNGLLAYVSEVTQNLGATKTNGEDIELLYKLPESNWGTFLVSMRGTYTNSYEQQVLPGGPWTQNVGQFGGVTLGTYSSNPLLTFRWKDNLSVRWSKGDWGAVVSDNYQTSYHDQNSVLPQYYHTIPSYSVVNATTTYTGIKNMALTFGVSNLFNRYPPATNSQSTGVLINYASAVGRAYQFNASYSFK